MIPRNNRIKSERNVDIRFPGVGLAVKTMHWIPGILHARYTITKLEQKAAPAAVRIECFVETHATLSGIVLVGTFLKEEVPINQAKHCTRSIYLPSSTSLYHR